MKKIFILALMLATVSAVSAETKMVRLTRFEGLDIRGVVASSAFNVEVYQSDKTYAVVEVLAELEDKLVFDFDSGSNIKLGFKSNLPRMFGKNRNEVTAKVYVKKLDNLDITGASDCKLTGKFVSDIVSVRVSGASKLFGMDIDARTSLYIDCGGASDVQGTVNTNLFRCEMNGASKGELNVTGKTVVFNASGASDISVEGSAEKLEVGTGGASSFKGSQYKAAEAKVHAVSASNVTIGETGKLDAEAMSASTIRYSGNPAPLNVSTGGAGSIKKI